MSNTSNGPAQKGSKYWIQTLVNLNNGKKFTKEIQKADPTIGEITWLSPLASEQYKEYKLNYKSIREKLDLKDFNMKFWPSGQPQWDAIGIVKNQNGIQNTLILVEAKAHISEIKTRCGAKAQTSIDLINTSLHATHDSLAKPGHAFDADLWTGRYYQVGNRLAFFNELKQQGYSVKLVFLNFVNDDFGQTSVESWVKHNGDVFDLMLGIKQTPEGVIVINMDI